MIRPSFILRIISYHFTRLFEGLALNKTDFICKGGEFYFGHYKFFAAEKTLGMSSAGSKKIVSLLTDRFSM